jgi:hypothetical protein
MDERWSRSSENRSNSERERERERERETQTHTKTHTHLHTKRLTNNGSAGKPPVESFKVNRCTTATITS